MTLFNPKKNTKKWAAVVMPSSAGKDVSKDALERVTAQYISQHMRILSDGIQLFLVSKDPATRKSRYKLAREHFYALCRVKKYANRKQKKAINAAIHAFVQAKELYRNPERATTSDVKLTTEQKQTDFEKAIEQFEMMDCIFDDRD